MTTIIDISMPLDEELASWPGDTDFRYGLAWRRSAGSAVNVGAVTMSMHFGTHVDAPFHFLEGGQTVDELALDPFLGPAVVLDARGRKTISRSFLEECDLQGAARVLFRTDAWPDKRAFPESIPVMEQGVPEWLQAEGVVLVGLDLPSVDHLDSKDLPIHHALADSRIAILESLYLRNVEEGVYELVALPLKLVGADGAPARAVLLSPDER